MNNPLKFLNLDIHEWDIRELTKNNDNSIKFVVLRKLLDSNEGSESRRELATCRNVCVMF